MSDPRRLRVFDAPRPFTVFEMLFKLDGVKIQYTGHRWRDEDIGHAIQPCFPDPTWPGTQLAMQIMDMQTLATATPETFAVDFDDGQDRPRRVPGAPPRPLVRYDILFRLEGRPFRMIAQRWREEDARHSSIPHFVNPVVPGTVLAVRMFSLRTGATCDPLPPEAISGEYRLAEKLRLALSRRSESRPTAARPGRAKGSAGRRA
jgi:hypothetical protein